MRKLIYLLSILAAVLSACGFHLRGAGEYQLPPALATLKVVLEGNQQENNPLLVAMKNALRTQAGVVIEDQGEVPRLILFGEKSDSQVLSVSSINKADEYLLKYELSFRLTDKDNKSLGDSQTVKLQRDHAFDRLNVLSTEREEQELRREMQRDAVQQILRRLARISLPAKL